jgi:hypothetical protein
VLRHTQVAVEVLQEKNLVLLISILALVVLVVEVLVEQEQMELQELLIPEAVEVAEVISLTVK